MEVMAMRRGMFLTLTTLCASLTLALTGCVASGRSTGSTVVFWDTSGPTEHAVFQELAEMCGKQGGYQVKVEVVSFDQALNNYKTAAQAGQGPDVLRSDVGWVSELAQDGLITDLSATALARDTSDFNPLALQSTRYDGKTYAVPQVIDVMGLYYNRKQLAAAALAPPVTWDQVAADAARLGGDKAIFLDNNAYYALPFIYGAGGDLLDVAAGKITVNSPINVAALASAKKLLDQHAAQTSLDPSNSYGNMQTAFSAGQVSMIIDGPWANGVYLQGSAFTDHANLGVARIPGPTPGAGRSPVGGQDYVIRRGTQAEDDAVKFVQCMASDSAQATVAEKVGDLPTRDSVLNMPAVQANPIVAAFGPLLRTAHARVAVPGWAGLLDPLSVAYSNVLAGKQDPASALDQVANKYAQLLPTYHAG